MYIYPELHTRREEDLCEREAGEAGRQLLDAARRRSGQQLRRGRVASSEPHHAVSEAQALQPRAGAQEATESEVEFSGTLRHGGVRLR